MALEQFARTVYSSSVNGLFVPRNRYNFTLVLEDYRGGSIVFYKVLSASVPGYTFDTTVLNQYNKKRVIQTRINYDPVNVVFYDTHDNLWFEIMRQYINHTYDNNVSFNIRNLLETNSTIVENFVTDFGFTPSKDKYYFKKLVLFQGGIVRNNQGGEFLTDDTQRVHYLINPVITQIQGDTMDYTDSQPIQYTVTFQPESVHAGYVEPENDESV